MSNPPKQDHRYSEPHAQWSPSVCPNGRQTPKNNGLQRHAKRHNKMHSSTTILISSDPIIYFALESESKRIRISLLATIIHTVS